MKLDEALKAIADPVAAKAAELALRQFPSLFSGKSAGGALRPGVVFWGGERGRESLIPIGHKQHEIFRRYIPLTGISMHGEVSLNEFGVLTFGWLPLLRPQ